MKKYVIVYKTTNIINGKFYIGVHGTNDLNDSYLGSGLNLEDAIVKYGKSSFKREIIQICQSYEEAFKLESELVTDDLIKSRNCYNIARGGNAGNLVSTKGIPKPEGFGKKISIAQNDPTNLKVIEGHKRAAEKLKLSDKSYTKTDEFKRNMSKVTSGCNNGMFGKKHSEETKQKIREKRLLKYGVVK